MWQPPRRAILVGVDGSAAALAAVRWAAHDAALRNVPLTLVHVVNTPVPGWSQVPAPAGFRQWQEKRAREFIKSAIKVAEEGTGERGPVQIDSKVFYSATVPTLVGLSKEAEMVVVGYRGHGGVLVRNFLGSVSSGLVYHAHCPVAVIHDEEPLVRQCHTGAGAGGHRRLAGVGSSDCDCIRGSVTTRCRFSGPACLD